VSAIGPGDFVECVRASIDRPGVLCVGSVYIVSRVIPGPFEGYCDFGVELVEPYSGCPWGWASFLFRPIYRRDESLTTRLLEGLPADAPRELERA
jgi:hypothetical protein